MTPIDVFLHVEDVSQIVPKITAQQQIYRQRYLVHVSSQGTVHVKGNQWYVDRGEGYLVNWATETMCSISGHVDMGYVILGVYRGCSRRLMLIPMSY